jgi:hypothetical protein
MPWPDELHSLIAGRWSIGQTFTLREAYEFVDQLAKLYPTNRHITDSIRVNLIRLREQGKVEMLSPGTYKRVA